MLCSENLYDFYVPLNFFTAVLESLWFICLSHLNMLPKQQKNTVIAWCYFAGVDTKITNVGITVKSTGLVYLYFCK